MSMSGWPDESATLLGAQPAALVIATFQPGEGFRHLHVHHRHWELFAVRSGLVHFRVGDRSEERGSGESQIVEPRTPHSFVALGPHPAEVAMVVSPPDIVDMIVKLGEAGDDKTLIGSIMRRYDSELVTPAHR